MTHRRLHSPVPGRRAVAAALVAALLLAGPRASAAGIVRGPYLQAGTATSMTVCWALDEARACTLEFGTTHDYGTAVASQTPTGHPRSRTHFARAEGLAPGTRYFYRVVSDGASLTADAPDLCFTTHLAEPTRPWSFFVLGDSGTRSVDQLRVAQLLEHLKPRPDFGLHTGDVTQCSGADEIEYDWCFFSVYGGILRTVPVYPTRGNHDSGPAAPWPLDPLAPRYAAASVESPDHPVWQAPFYSVFRPHGSPAYRTPAPSTFDYANARFVCADIATLRRDLEDCARQAFADSDKVWHFFYGHWSVGKLFDQVEAKRPLPRIDMILEGHRHLYSRGAPRGPHATVSLLIGASGADVKEQYLAEEVTERNPDGLSDEVRWAEKSPHVAHVLVDGSKLTVKVYYPDGIVADWLEITVEDGRKRFREMAAADHPRRPLWQRKLTAVQERLWVERNPKWEVLQRDRRGRAVTDRYVGSQPLERLALDATALRPPEGERSLESFYPTVPARRGRVDDAAACRWALRELASERYALDGPPPPKGGLRPFGVRLLELMGATPPERLVEWLVAAARDGALPLRERLVAVAGLGVVRTAAADDALAELAGDADLDVASSAWVVLARERADRRGLLAIRRWLEAQDESRRFAGEVAALCGSALRQLVTSGPGESDASQWADYLAAHADQLVFDPQRMWRLPAPRKRR